MKMALVLVVFLLFAVVSAPAATGGAPGPNQVVIIARIVLDPPLPVDFYHATLRASQPLKASLKMPDLTEPNDCGVYVGIQSSATLLKRRYDHYTGPLRGFLRTTIQVPADRRVEVGPFRVVIFGSEYLTITIPARWSILVPEGARYVYLGTLVFSYAGYYYEFTGTTRIDEFDEAQAIITGVYGEDARLLRVNLLDLEKE